MFLRARLIAIVNIIPLRFWLVQGLCVYNKWGREKWRSGSKTDRELKCCGICVILVTDSYAGFGRLGRGYRDNDPEM